ncbi:uncharacterized protein AKAME5_000535400 [Lates japonicus]|uniref:Uncharacterized protein n=1 Tax=Lates japonicus TaxID=270547 RepID=A0AAD3MEB1_LATJO|nr:uncharacterized protein AKAME5_000535400 [Lates japonicus]
MSCGIYQGDALSTVRFYRDMNLLSQIITKIGKMISTEGAELLEGSNKYLGILQAHGSHEEVARKSATAKYLHRIRQVLKSQLNGKNKV